MSEPRSEPVLQERAPSLARNSLWNLLGQGLPLAAALVCIPPLIRLLGVERFGILTLISAVIGYFGVFDLGIGRALTKFVAERAQADDEGETARLIWTALVLLLALSVVAAAIVALLSAWLTRSVLSVSPQFQRQTVGALRIIALGFPVVFAGNGLRGVLEARGRFGLTNLVRAPMGVWNFLGPLVALQVADSLTAVTVALVAGGALGCAAYLAMCLAVVPGLGRHMSFDFPVVRPLLRLGSWMTVSSVIGPLMVYMDRFVIGAVATMSVVAYYTTPYALVSRLWVLPLSLIGVLFPIFSRTYAADRQRASTYLARGVRYVSLMVFPPVLVIVALAREGLDLWLGPVFAEHSTAVLQILAAAVFFNSLAQVAFSLVQGAGRADLTATLHLIELPIYLGALWWMIARYGVIGAAVTWAVRMIVDAAVLFVFVGRLLPQSRSGLRRLALASVGIGATFALAAAFSSTVPRIAFVAAVLAVFAVLGWRVVLTADERSRLRHPLAVVAGWPAQ
jgi:O-antigen/teichoic acid export membrane protein